MQDHPSLKIDDTYVADLFAQVYADKPFHSLRMCGHPLFLGCDSHRSAILRIHVFHGESILVLLPFHSSPR